jgi:hypothetical protein
MGRSAKCADTLQNLRWVFLLKKIDGQECIMLVEVQWWRLAGTEK